MQIVQAVFGVFHHFELAHQLRARGHLRRIYSTWPWARLKREGLPREFVGTFPWIHTADYLLSQSRLYPHAANARMTAWNAALFDLHMRRTLPPCDALIALSGAGVAAGPLVQTRGGKFLCDRGSTHQRYQYDVVAEEHRRWRADPPPAFPEILAREERCYELADAIVVPSHVARRSFLAMGVPAEKVHVIPYGVRLERFFPAAPPPSDAFEVLFAGNVSLRKGVPFLLEAFARLRHPRKRLSVVGSLLDGDMRRLLPTLPTEGVVFTGPLAQPELAARMSRSHVLVLPSVEEGLALVQGEAMACGCPVIATIATGAEDLFTDGVEGFIVPDRDSAALTGRMQQLADDPALRERMSAAALERVQSLGGWETFGARWDALLHALTGVPRNLAEQ